jgi:CBS-domain-containing membrane protein
VITSQHSFWLALKSHFTTNNFIQTWLLDKCRTLTAKEFIANARQSSGEKQMSIITCTKEDTVKDIILRLDAEKRQRVYVVNEEGNLDGLITLRDIIAKLVYEPPGYFGDFFNGVIPMPQNSRV